MKKTTQQNNIPDKMNDFSKIISNSITSNKPKTKPKTKTKTKPKKKPKTKTNTKTKKNSKLNLEVKTGHYNFPTSLKINKEKLFEQIKSIAEKFTCKDINIDRIKKHLGSGVSNRVDLFCVDSGCKMKAACRFMPISKSYPTGNTHPVNVEINIYKKFNEIKTPHVPILYKNLECRYTDVLVGNDIISKYKEQIENDEIQENLNIMLLEFCDGGSFKDFVKQYRHNKDYLICAFFQVLTALTILQVTLKNFRHNDIHANNIAIGVYDFKNEKKYIKSLKENKGKKYYVCYEMLGTKYYIPYLGFCIKIFDFDVSCSDEFPNSKVKIDTVYKRNGVICKGNPAFDTHLFINSALYSLCGYDENGIFDEELVDIDNEILNFYKGAIPYPKLRGFNSDELGYARTKEIINFPKDLKSAVELLQHILFDSYKTKPKDEEIIFTYNTGLGDLTSLKRNHPEIFTNNKNKKSKSIY